MSTTIATSPADIRAAIRTALTNGPARIAVPFWGRGALTELGLDKGLAADVKVLCNLSVGGCNPAVIRELIDRGIQVRALSSLHAKVYLGTTAAVMGSANASGDGLGLFGDDAGWNEACALIEDQSAVDQLGAWFQGLWDRAADLSDPQIARLLLEKAERAPSGLQVDPLNLLDALRANPRCLAKKQVYVTLDYEPYGSRVERKVQDLQKQLGDDIDAWEDWAKMPPAAEILSFYYDRRSGEVTFEGIYESPNDPAGSMDPETKGIFVTRARRVLGIYELGDMSKWLLAADRLRRAVFVKGKASDDALTLSLTDFASTYLTNPLKR